MNALPYSVCFRRPWLLLAAICLFLIAPLSGAAVPAASPAGDAVAERSAKRAELESGKISQAGIAYTRWLDRLPRGEAEAFLRRPVFDRVTWMRLLASAATLLVAAGLAVGLLWFIKRQAGPIESQQHQSWLELTFAALRKPLALLAVIVGAFFALMPIVLGVADPAWRDGLARGMATGIYAGRVIVFLWLIFQGVRAVEKRMRGWAERTGKVLNMIVVPMVGQTLRLVVPLCAIILLLPVLHLPADWTWLVQKALGILLVVGVCAVIVRGTKAVQSGLMATHKLEAEDNLAARQIFTRVSVIRRIIVSAVFLVGGAAVLMMFGPLRQFGTSILASAGIAGVVLGFAAQKTLGNVLAGIQIALSQPMLIDDVVVVEGEFGRIEEITLTFVVVRTWDLRRLVLPITYFIEKPFQNWSRRSTDVLGTVYLYLDYHVPLGPLRAEMKRLVEGNENWDRKVCALQVTDTKQSTVEVRALMSSGNASKLFDLRCQVREGLIEFLRSEHPESLPRIRTAFERLREESETVPKNGRALAGQQHQRGSTSPGLEMTEEATANGQRR